MFCDVPLLYFSHVLIYTGLGTRRLGVIICFAWRLHIGYGLPCGFGCFGMTLYPFYYMLQLLPLQPTSYTLHCFFSPCLEAGHLTRTLEAYHTYYLINRR
jgi:hypothetical protein